MKIVQLNTHSYGGAAVVARRLHRSARAAGIDSWLVTQYGVPQRDVPAYQPLRSARVRYALRAGVGQPQLYRVGKFVQTRLQHRNLVGRPAGLEIFSPLNTRAQFADCLDAFAPDIVHLHWVAGFVDHEAFFRHNRARRFVWTLHDMNPFTGGCHHSDGCTNYEHGCPACPQLQGTREPEYAAQVWRNKAAALRQLDDGQLIMVSPSRWLLELSQRSPLTSRFRHVLIENPAFDSAVADDQHAAREFLGIAPDKKVVVFVSENLRNPRKGTALLLDAVRRMQHGQDVQLIGLGQRATAPSDVSVSFPGRIKDERRLARYLAAADVLVSPSVAENSPLTIIEALSCGTPVVSFPVGGVPELVDERCGLLPTEQTAESLAAALDEALFARKFDRAYIREHGAKHQPALVLEKYRAVYDQLLSAS